jgi:hypothetical protein
MLLNRQIGFGLIIGLLLAKYDNSLVETKHTNLMGGQNNDKEGNYKERT